METNSFVSYVHHITKRLLNTTPGTISFQEWFDHNRQGEERNKSFTDTLRFLESIDPRISETESFIKDEFYADPKNPRLINAYNDECKAMLGAIQRYVDLRLYDITLSGASGDRCVFPKHFDVSTRASLLEQHLSHHPVVGTDFTSMEKHHRGIRARLGFFWISHVLRPLGLPSDVLDLVYSQICTTNQSRLGNFRLSIDQTLMSGAVWTSSLNGFLNFSLISYCYLRSRYPQLRARALSRHVDDFVGFVEGDDGIFVCSQELDLRVVNNLGLDLKFDYFKDYTRASFCGIVKPDHDSNDLITDPKKILNTFFFSKCRDVNSTTKKINGLQRAKALSLYFMYRNCPIVSVLCKNVLKLTRSYNVDLNAHGWWEKGVLKLALDEMKSTKFHINHVPQCSPQSRLCVEELFGIEVSLQIQIEEQLDLWGNGLPHKIPYVPCMEKNYIHGAKYLFETKTNFSPPPTVNNNFTSLNIFRGANQGIQISTLRPKSLSPLIFRASPYSRAPYTTRKSIIPFHFDFDFYFNSKN
nr:hypothetical protein [Tolivirales sp.]